MQRTDFGDMTCSIARALSILGDWWTPLILRDLLVGFTQFDEIRQDLGISTNVLSDRLGRLVEHGVVAREPYGSHPNRFEYRLTHKGEDAIPILLALVAWGDRWEVDKPGPPTLVVHSVCGKATTAVAHCAECGVPLKPEDLEYHKGPGSRQGPGTQLLRERLGPLSAARSSRIREAPAPDRP
ncbi:MAG TPA: helix-turn-helix domain-containing protein [Acidimicrobiia bacterium]|nr:helix-turn-helix domain-containing protein [Acidimicrobiia bacterium]